MSKSPEIVRVLRLLEYVGERKWVEDTLSRSSVPLNGTSPNWDRDSGYIRSGMVGSFPEVVQGKVATHPDYHAIENIKQVLKERMEYHAEHKLIVDGADTYRYILEYVEQVQKQFNLLGE